MILAEENRSTGGKKTQSVCHFVHHASDMDLPGNASGNRLHLLGVYGRIILNSILEKWKMCYRVTM